MPYGATCAGGGTRIDVGLDNGDEGGIAGNGALEIGEIDSTGYVCAPPPLAGTYLFRAGQGESGVLQRYAIASDTWSTVTAAPATFASSLATNGTSVYAYLTDNTLSAYDIAGNSWSVVSSTGPAGGTEYGAGFLSVTLNGVYYCPFDQPIMNRYQSGVWTSIPLPSSCSTAGTFDPSTGNLYVRESFSNNFMVLNSATGTVTTTVLVSGSQCEITNAGTYYAGNFYYQPCTSPIEWVNATVGGTPTSIGLNSASWLSAMATDFGAGVIYLAGYGDNFDEQGRALVRYDPVAGTLTKLASAPNGVYYQSSLVLVP